MPCPLLLLEYSFCSLVSWSSTVLEEYKLSWALDLHIHFGTNPSTTKQTVALNLKIKLKCSFVRSFLMCIQYLIGRGKTNEKHRKNSSFNCQTYHSVVGTKIFLGFLVVYDLLLACDFSLNLRRVYFLRDWENKSERFYSKKHNTIFRLYKSL